MPDPGVSVRTMTEQDCRWAAALHSRCLPHGFFASLGPGFLGAYYATFLASPHAVALVAETADTPAAEAGVLVGTTANAAHYRSVLRDSGPRLALTGGLALTGRPRQLATFLRSRAGRYLRALSRYLRRSDSSGTGTGAGATAAAPARRGRRGRRIGVLTHVSVAEFARGTGAGRALVEAYVAAAREAGCTEVQLVTLAGPDGAGGFYERLGWTHRDSHTDHDGRAVQTWTRRLA